MRPRVLAFFAAVLCGAAAVVAWSSSGDPRAGACAALCFAAAYLMGRS